MCGRGEFLKEHFCEAGGGKSFNKPVGRNRRLSLNYTTPMHFSKGSAIKKTHYAIIYTFLIQSGNSQKRAHCSRQALDCAMTHTPLSFHDSI